MIIGSKLLSLSCDRESRAGGRFVARVHMVFRSEVELLPLSLSLSLFLFSTSINKGLYCLGGY